MEKESFQSLSLFFFLYFTAPLTVLNPTSSQQFFFIPLPCCVFFRSICYSACPCTVFNAAVIYLPLCLPTFLSLMFIHSIFSWPICIYAFFKKNLYLILCLNSLMSLRLSVCVPKHIHLYKRTPLSPSFPLCLQSMPISSACLVFDGACPPHRPPQKPHWSRHGTSDSSISLQLAGNWPKGHRPSRLAGAKMADRATEKRRG